MNLIGRSTLVLSAICLLQATETEKISFSNGFSDASVDYLFIPVSIAGVQYSDPLIFSIALVAAIYTHKNNNEISMKDDDFINDSYLQGYRKGKAVKNIIATICSLTLGYGLKLALN